MARLMGLHHTQHCFREAEASPRQGHARTLTGGEVPAAPLHYSDLCFLNSRCRASKTMWSELGLCGLLNGLGFCNKAKSAPFPGQHSCWPAHVPPTSCPEWHSPTHSVPHPNIMPPLLWPAQEPAVLVLLP